MTAYLLAATAALPIYGKLSDMFGRVRMLSIGIGLFLAGSVACALARICQPCWPPACCKGWGQGLIARLYRDRRLYSATGGGQVSGYISAVYAVSASQARCSVAILPSSSAGAGSSGSICRSALSPSGW